MSRPAESRRLNSICRASYQLWLPLSTRNGSPSTPGLTTKKFGVASAFSAGVIPGSVLLSTELRLFRNVDVLNARLLANPKTLGLNGFRAFTKVALANNALV